MNVVDTAKQVTFDLKIEYANQLPNGSTSVSEIVGINNRL
jgi:hypothetical protein